MTPSESQQLQVLHDLEVQSRADWMQAFQEHMSIETQYQLSSDRLEAAQVFMDQSEHSMLLHIASREESMDVAPPVTPVAPVDQVAPVAPVTPVTPVEPAEDTFQDTAGMPGAV